MPYYHLLVLLLGQSAYCHGQCYTFFDIYVLWELIHSINGIYIYIATFEFFVKHV